MTCLGFEAGKCKQKLGEQPNYQMSFTSDHRRGSPSLDYQQQATEHQEHSMESGGTSYVVFFRTPAIGPAKAVGEFRNVTSRGRRLLPCSKATTNRCDMGYIAGSEELQDAVCACDGS
eukprot:6194132-Pleurochrysis_carterae.AAC.4